METIERDAVKEAKKAVWDAEDKLRALNGQLRDDLNEAKCKVEAIYADRISAATTAVREAGIALRDAMDAAVVPHKWDGKKVRKVTPRHDRWSNRVVGENVEEGIVETVTARSQFAANLGNHNRPNIGQTIVREIKKDGKPSLKFHGSGWNITGDNVEAAGWKLAD